MISQSFLVGYLRASGSGKMILLLLAASILTAAPTVVPIFTTILLTTDDRAIAGRLLANRIDAIWLTDLLNGRLEDFSLVSAGAQYGLMLAGAAFVHLILSVLFAGGILEVYATDDRRFTMRRFWAGSGGYFWRFVRLWLLALVGYGLAIFVYVVMRALISSVDATSSSERTGAILSLVALALFLLLCAVVNMVFDYARIGTVRDKGRSMWRETMRAARFAFHHFKLTFPLYLLVTLTGLIFFAALARLRDGVPQSSLPAVLLALLLGQLAIISRIWARLACYAAELDLNERLRPSPPVILAEDVPIFAAANPVTVEINEELNAS